MVKPFHNPALQEEPQSQAARVIPPRQNESLYKWIENSGRFKPREPDEVPVDEIPDELEDIMETPIYKLGKSDDDDEEFGPSDEF